MLKIPAPRLSLETLEKLRIVGKTIVVQALLFCSIVLTVWGTQALYGLMDPNTFPEAYAVKATATSTEPEKGKALADAITWQLRRELDSTFGWSANDIVFSRYVLDNRGYRQFGVYQATKVLMDQFSMQIAKLGGSDRESKFLYEARLNSFSINPRSFMFPSAEGAYKKGLKLIEQYKLSLDKGTGVYNMRTDDLHSSFELAVGENMLGYALGLLQNAQSLPFYTLDNRIYEVQGMVLVLRDFLHAIYTLYPEVRSKNNEENMRAAMQYMDLICTYDPMYITSKVNCGELVISWLTFTRNRLSDIRDSIRM